jgi:hypothetical protein
MKVLDVMQRVGNVIGKIHHRALQSLPARRKIRKCANRFKHLREVDDVGGELRRSFAAPVPGTARGCGPVRGMRIGIVEAGPGILQHRSPSRGREVEPLVARSKDL